MAKGALQKRLRHREVEGNLTKAIKKNQCDDGSRERRDDSVWGSSHRQARNTGDFQEAGKGTEIDCPLESPEGTRPENTLVLAP